MTVDRGRPRALLANAARPAALYLASRLVVFTAMMVAGLVHKAGPHGTSLTPYHMLRTWDAAWYVELIKHGYPHALPVVNGRAQQSTFGFFPLFPLLARAVGRVFGLSAVAAGTVTAGLLGLVVCILLWFLTARLVDGPSADRAVALFAFSPGAFVLSIAYSESLMLALALACLWLLLERRWLLAGVAAGLATATRPNGMALFVCCAFAAAAYAWSRRREWRAWAPALAAPALAPVGPVAFLLFLHQRAHTARAYFRVQDEGWGLRFSATGPLTFFNHFRHDPRDVNLMVGVLAMAVALVLLVVVWRSGLPPLLLVFAAAVVAMGTLSTAWAPLRFVLTAFPFSMALGKRLSQFWFSVVLAVSAGLLGLMVVLVVLTQYLTP